MSKDLGDKIGPRLAALIGRYVLAARRDTAPIEARVHQAATQALIDKAGREVADHIGPLLVQAIDANPDMHAGVKDYLLRTASGRHQLQAIAGHLAIGGAGSVLSTLLSNELAPFAYAIVGENPHLRFDAATAASLEATGILEPGGAAGDGNAAGFDTERVNWLVQAAQAVPDAVTIGDMINRGLITAQDGDYWIKRGGYGPSLHHALLELRRALLSPADAALAVLRGNMDQAEGVAIAERSGVSAADFSVLVDNTGEPPATESLLEAFRRRIIDRARLVRGIRQSRVRNEWTDVIEALRYQPISTADAVNAVVQNHLTAAEAEQIAEQNGLEPGQIATLIANAGEPLSRTELEQLYNRGEISEAIVIQGLRESRLKDKYVQDAFRLHVRLPEGRQVVSMITHAAISKDEGLRILAELGFSPQIAAALILEGTNTKIGAHKDLTLAEVRQLFADGVFTEQQAREHVTGLGFDQQEAGYLLKSWQLLAGAAVTRQAVGAIRARYVGHDLTWERVSADLDQLGVPATAKDTYRKVWDIERAARTAVLSEAQIVAAHKKELITGPDAFARLTARGYAEGDAKILLGVGPGDPVPA